MKRAAPWDAALSHKENHVLHSHTDNALLGMLDEVEDGLDLRAIGNSASDTRQGILQGGVALVNLTVGFRNIVDDFLRYMSLFRKNDCIDPIVIDGVVGSDHVGRHIFVGTATVFEQRPSADAATVFDDDATANNGTVVNPAVACGLRAIAEYAIIADLGVVGKVDAFEQEVSIPDDRLVACVRGTVDDDFLTEDIVIADDEQGVISLELEVLRSCAQDGSLIHNVVYSHTGAPEDTGVWHDGAIVANDDIAVDAGERVNGDILPYLRFRIYIS